jgi:hypothetical protein
MTASPGDAAGASRTPAGPPPYSYPPGVYPPPALPSNGLAVASLIVGVVAVATSPLLVGLGLGIAAVAMGVSARRRVRRGITTHGGGLALGGVVLGIVATVIGLAVGAILAFGVATDQFNEDYQHCLGEHNGMAQYCEQYR